MIYEILVRPSYSKRMTSDHLVWIESDLPTRSFEKWLREQSLMDDSGRAAVVRWSIVQSQRAAHFSLATQAKALISRIAELMSGTPEPVSLSGSLPQVDSRQAKKPALAVA
ncbi:hypothetical protein BH11PSE12_BH11PSE12_11420 [soil metagenome]